MRSVVKEIFAKTLIYMVDLSKSLEKIKGEINLSIINNQQQ